MFMCVHVHVHAEDGVAENFSEHLLSFSIRKTALAESRKAQILVLAL